MSRILPTLLVMLVLGLGCLVPHDAPWRADHHRLANFVVADVVGDGAVAYSPENLANLRAGGTPVFVDIRADRCVMCIANGYEVLDSNFFQNLLKRTSTVHMEGHVNGDGAGTDPAISALLQEYHAPRAPLYVVFPKHNGPGRQISTYLTRFKMEKALTMGAR